MAITTCIFDAYGTLFDVAAAARQAAAEPGFEALQEKWRQVAGHWRLKQLQYTWLRAVADAHADFWDVTQDGLDWALEATGLQGEAELRQRLLDLYWELQAFPEAPDMLKTLKEGGLQTAILSNGVATNAGRSSTVGRESGMCWMISCPSKASASSSHTPGSTIWSSSGLAAPGMRCCSSVQTAGMPPVPAVTALSLHG